MRRLLVIILLPLLFLGCDEVVKERGNGKIESEKRVLEGFTEINLAGNYEVGLKHGAQEQVVIVTDENLLPYIESSVENGVLIIEDSERIKSADGIKIFITYDQISKIKSAGASVVKSEDVISSDVFSLMVPGAGLIDLKLDVEDLEVELAGAGLVKLSGRADSQHVTLKGVGSLEAFDLESNTCDVSVSGVGGAEVNVKENLTAVVRGIGGIKYKGDPKSVQDEVSGIGTIKSAKEREDT